MAKPKSAQLAEERGEPNLGPRGNAAEERAENARPTKQTMNDAVGSNSTRHPSHGHPAARRGTGVNDTANTR